MTESGRKRDSVTDGEVSQSVKLASKGLVGSNPTYPTIHCRNCHYEPKNRGVSNSIAAIVQCYHPLALSDPGNKNPCRYFVPKEGIELEWYIKGWDDLVRIIEGRYYIKDKGIIFNPEEWEAFKSRYVAKGCTTNLGIIGATCNCGAEYQAEQTAKMLGEQLRQEGRQEVVDWIESNLKQFQGYQYLDEVK